MSGFSQFDAKQGTAVLKGCCAAGGTIGLGLLLVAHAAAQPAAAGKKVAATTLVVRAVIDGSDALRVTADGFEWIHRAGNWPADVTLNERSWDPQRQPRLAGDDLAAYLPAGFRFGPLEVSEKRGRGGVFARPSEKGEVYFEFLDPAEGASPYIITFRLRDLSWLASGTPRVPRAAAGGAYPGDLRVTARVEGHDTLLILKDRAEWRRNSGEWAEDVKINGVSWSPRQQKTLSNSSRTAFMPEKTQLAGATLWQLRGRGSVELQETSGGLEIEIEDPENGADDYEFVIHQGETFPKPAILEEDRLKIRQMSIAKPKAPHPAAKDLPTARDLENLRRQWNRSRLALAYEKFGRRDPTWDAAARAFLEMDALPRHEQEPAEDIVEAGYRLIDLRCDDPLVAYVVARHLSRLGRLAEAEPFALHAVLTFEKMKYPRRTTRAAPALLSHLYLRQSSPRSREAYALAQRSLVETVEATRDSLPGDERRALFLELREGSQNRSLFPGQEQALLRMLHDTGDCDAWITHMLLADYLDRQAWGARGGGYANTVTSEGGAKYRQMTLQEEGHLVAAWSEHPRYPEPAVQMIMAVHGVQPVVSETQRFWFDQAVAAQIDADRAHSTMLWTLRPRWLGSHEKMLRFGVECLATGRFDTEVPGTLIDAIQGILEEHGDLRGLVTRLKFGDEIREGLQKLELGKTDEELQVIKTRNLIIAFALGWRDEAQRRLQELKDDFHVATAAQWNYSREYLRYDLGHEPRSFADAPTVQWGEPLYKGPTPLNLMLLADDGQNIAIESTPPEGNRVTIWNVPDKKSLDLRPASGFKFSMLAFSRDSNALAMVQQPANDAAGRGSARVTLWNKGEPTARALPAVRFGTVSTLDWLPDNRLLAVNTSDRVQIVDPQSNRVLAATREFDDRATVLAVSPVDSLLAVGFADGMIQLYKVPALDNLPEGGVPKAITHLADLKRHLYGVESLDFSFDGRTLASASREDKSIWIWDLAARETKYRLPGWRLAFSRDSRRVATSGGWDMLHEAVIWDLENGRAIKRCLCPPDKGTAGSVAFTPDDESLIGATNDGVIHTWPAR